MVAARQACHRNRYGEYICKSCQGKGKRFTWTNRVAYHLRASATAVGVGVGGVGVAVMTAWVLYVLVYRLEFSDFYP